LRGLDKRKRELPMMSDGNSRILIETFQPPGPAANPAVEKLEPGSTPVGGFSRLARTYEEVSSLDIQNAIASVGNAVMTAMRKLNPQECEVEFHIGFTAGGGVPILASGEAHGSLKVSLKWSGNEQRA
jgi:hypothetical protein